MLANPRKWPLVLAGVLAGSFLSLSAKGDEGEDTSDSSVLPGELEDLPEQSASCKYYGYYYLLLALAGASIIKI